ncbi:alpha/beta fold hydrolase [Oceanibaculum sp.]|uniref:alpha/beta fold hydrolase n=1 Tax=Oceanibaculum sp. TaxID=1903597 RepID=UPI0025831725|nr:alpha/beta hydrolase [Oceanibaculum sp.]MCH2396295.1 alpha/beta hydrolase [Oceanibaculum sp.]
MGGAPSAYRERFFSASDGVSLYFREYGTRDDGPLPAILCLPGLARNSKDFDGLARHLAARGHSVVVPDYRGRGRSGRCKNWRDYAPAQVVEDIRHLLDIAGLHRVVVIGTSLGGAIAMALGAMAPSRLAGVVLNDIGPDVAHDSGGESGAILRYVGQNHPVPDWDSAIAWLQELMPDLSFTTPQEWREFAEATFVPGDDGLLHLDWDPAIALPFARGAASGYDLWALFGSLRPFPLLVVRGGVSRILTEPVFRRMTAWHPACRSVTLPGVGHAPALTEPTCLEAIDDFLDQYRPAALR